MKKSVRFLAALLLTGGASLAVAQVGTAGNNLTNNSGWNSGVPAQSALGPTPPMFSPSPSTPNVLLNSCDATGCWGADGTRYTRTGNALFGSNGKICNLAAPGAPAMCN
jgi:hypothetical protein